MNPTSRHQGAAVVLACAMACLLGNGFGFFDSLELKSIDRRFKTRNALAAPRPVSDKIVVIEIDDDSARRLAAPFLLWDSYFTQVLASLNESSAKVIALDVLWLKSIEDFVELKTPSLRKPLVRELMRAATAHRLVLAAPQTTQDVSLGKHAVLIGTDNFAAVNPILDSDKTIRRQSLAYEAVDANSKPTQLATLPALVATRYENKTLALSDPFLIDFTSEAASFEHHSFFEVEQHAARGDHAYFEKTFGGKIALLGTTSSLLDRHKTPLGAETPGVYVHAFAIESLLGREPLQMTGRVSEALEIIFMCLLLGGPALYLSSVLAGACAIASGLLYTGLVYFMFCGGLVLPWAGPMVSAGLTLAMVLAYRFTVSDREKRRLTSIFKHYVNSKIVDLLVAHPDSVGITGRRRQVCVLFSDIRGFTQLSETLSPEQIVNFLNTYLSAMSEIILAHDGTVDKFIGDGIMAYFGAPLENANAARDAVLAALDMQTRLRALNAQWQSEGKSSLKIGIGIHYGDAIIGNIGSKLKMDYTAIGDAVNLASRVESLTKELKQEVLITASVLEKTGGQFITEDVGEVPVRGHSPVRLYGVQGESK